MLLLLLLLLLFIIIRAIPKVAIILLSAYAFNPYAAGGQFANTK